MSVPFAKGFPRSWENLQLSRVTLLRFSLHVGTKWQRKTTFLTSWNFCFRNGC